MQPGRRGIVVGLSSLFLAASSLSAQPPVEGAYQGRCRLSGKVVYGDTVKPAARVQVTLEQSGWGTDRSVFTDAAGAFEFREISCASFEVVASEEHYRPARALVEFSFSSFQYVSLVLEPEVKLSAPAPDGPTISVREAQIPAKARKAFEAGLRELSVNNSPRRSLLHFQEAIQIFPQYDEAYVHLAMAHLRLNSPAEAAEVLERAVTGNPAYARAHLLLGMVRSQQGLTQRAVAALEKALELEKDTWQAHLELGRIYLLGAQVERASAHAREAHRLRPDTPAVHYLLYNVCVVQKDYKQALAEVDELLVLRPNGRWSDDLRQRRALLRRELGLPTE